jgi:hypothetical protein
MSQHYPDPYDVYVPQNAWATNSLKRIIERDGLIVPILVRLVTDDRPEPYFASADQHQGARVLACRDLGFETILVETEWTEDDL